MPITQNSGMLEGARPFDGKSETSDMRGGFGTLRSEDTLHGGLAVSGTNKPGVQNSPKWHSHFGETMLEEIPMKKFSHFSVKDLTFAAVIAALYAALTVVFAPISYGAVQFRVAEALTLLPVLFPQAIPGLAVGCLVANLIGGYGIWDVVFGTLATLIAAILTRGLRRNVWLAAVPPVLVNAVVVGLMLRFVLELPLLPTMATVGAGQIVVVYILGVPLIYALSRVHVLKQFTDKLKKE
jgi:uncharacterized membrane protein